jgi:hypothetical protein
LGTLRWRAGKSLDAITFASDGNTIACASYCGLWLLPLYAWGRLPFTSGSPVRKTASD